jgi:hypothetical protein
MPDRPTLPEPISDQGQARFLADLFAHRCPFSSRENGSSRPTIPAWAAALAVGCLPAARSQCP